MAEAYEGYLDNYVAHEKCVRGALYTLGSLHSPLPCKLVRVNVDACKCEGAWEQYLFQFQCWLDATKGLKAKRPVLTYRAPTKGGKSDYK
eukprot:1148392-Pelagomonas_calceolata.AAC.15